MNIILHKLYKREQVSVARFNDGEIGALIGDLKKTSRGEQEVDNTLVSGLLKALTYDACGYYKGFPCPSCYPYYYEYFADRCTGYERKILSTFATNHNYWNFLQELDTILTKRDWCLVSDKDVNFGGFHYHIQCPSENAMSHAEGIITECLETDAEVFVLTCGAASRYIAMELHKEKKSALDLGSIFDPIKGKKKRNGRMIDAHVWESPYKNNTKFCGICNHAGG